MHHLIEIPEFEGSYALAAEGPAIAATVFVHGFLGDAEGTWRDFQHLIDEKPAPWAATDLYFFAYDSFYNSVGTSAKGLRDFLAWVVARPDAFFEVSYPVWKTASGPPSGWVRVGLREGGTRYDTLTLAAHSLGGLVVRMMIREDGLEHERIVKKGTPPIPPLPRSLMAQLRLFAPAISGARPAGLPGLTLELGGIGALARVALGQSPSYKAMIEKSQLLTIVREGTEGLALRHDGWTGLLGDILWPKTDRIVEDIGYETDAEYKERPPGTTHTTICKPGTDFPVPLEFLDHGAR